ncbi:MAG TPA: YcbK family protein [Pseudomonadales bacterium]|nr:YcbK family protein [Pseudomonadales bacterium]
MLFTRKTSLDLPDNEHVCTQRRRLLRGMAGGAVALVAPGLVNAERLPTSQRSLSFVHIDTGEKMSLVYKMGDRFLPRSMASIAHLMRDYRSGDIHPIDPQLLDVLWKVQHNLKNSRPFEIISAYRSPATNLMMRNRSAHTGVAKKSMHLTGQAIDLRLPGSALCDVRDAAKELKRGGVGYYAESNFVHIDTGSVRYW